MSSQTQTRLGSVITLQFQQQQFVLRLFPPAFVELLGARGPIELSGIGRQGFIQCKVMFGIDPFTNAIVSFRSPLLKPLKNSICKFHVACEKLVIQQSLLHFEFRNVSLQKIQLLRIPRPNKAVHQPFGQRIIDHRLHKMPL